MSNLVAEKVLRVNCPGFGVSSTLPLGEAKPLAMYEVIVLNPTSIIHLFEPKSEAASQIDKALKEGADSVTLSADCQLESINAELELREHELRQFLSRGGLLVYFLAPSFTVNGPTVSLDNYLWLYEWGPTKIQHCGKRNIISNQSFQNIKSTSRGKANAFAAYLEQPGLKWDSIISSKNLAEEYKPLAGAGPGECVAAYRSSGPRKGQVVFLPAPYDAQYDDVLKECLLKWHAEHNGADSDKQELEFDDNEIDLGLAASPAENRNLLDNLFSDDYEEPQQVQSKNDSSSSDLGSRSDSALDWPELGQGLLFSDQDKELDLELDKAFERVRASAEELGSTPEELGSAVSKKETKAAQKSDNVEEAKDLISKLQDHVVSAPVPEWCSALTFEELNELQTELSGLLVEQEKLNQRVFNIEDRVRNLSELKDALLSQSGTRLSQACAKVFEALGWTVQISPNADNELWLNDSDKTQAIVRITYTSGPPNRSELAVLAESAITYWGNNDVEPKGILVASTYSDLSPEERPAEDFPVTMIDFAKRKNLNLITSLQLLSIYKDIAVDNADTKKIRENILTTSGVLADFELALRPLTEEQELATEANS